MPASPKLSSLGPLSPIVDVDLCRMRGLDVRAVTTAFFEGGARIVQVRQKSGGAGEFLEHITQAVAAAAPHGGTVIVNDRADLAVLGGASGVHVGQQDLAVTDVLAIAGPTAICGLSTHTSQQVDDAVVGPASYIAVGPVFRTGTKDTGYDPRGLELVRYAAGKGKPVVAIGGITLERAAAVLAAGAAAVAVISDLLGGGDPRARVAQYLDALGTHGP